MRVWEVTSSVDALRIRQRLGRSLWCAPRPFGPDGWTYTSKDGDWSIIVSVAEQSDGLEWIHASIAGQRMPSYDQLAALHHGVFGDGYAYQCFVPYAHHVNIHKYALHLWGRLDGKPALPEFGEYGTI